MREGIKMTKKYQIFYTLITQLSGLEFPVYGSKNSLHPSGKGRITSLQ